MEERNAKEKINMPNLGQGQNAKFLERGPNISNFLEKATGKTVNTITQY